MPDRSTRQAFDLFLAVATQLNRELLIVPVLYGSLGLARVLHASQSVGDVDILVPAAFLAQRWPELLALMERLHFALVDAREHEFRRGDESVAFADQESLVPFANVDPGTLATATVQGVHFKELSPQDYLAVYRVSQHDGYRRDKRGKRDAEKIAQIETFLKQQAS
ncbi:MAG TPA: hypothetical protein VGD58_05990 [Herpetosiphonaceae bacterium]